MANGHKTQSIRTELLERLSDLAAALTIERGTPQNVNDAIAYLLKEHDDASS